MRLWLAEFHVEYEGSDVLGAFTTKVGAEAACTNHKATRTHDDGWYPDDFHWDTREIELDTELFW
jgi:hypothetical protein